MNDELSKAIAELDKFHETQLNLAAISAREQCRVWTIRAFILGLIVGGILVAVACAIPQLL